MTDEKKGEEAGGAAAAPEAPSTEVAATDGGEKQKRMLSKEMTVQEGQKAGDKYMLAVPWGGEVEVTVPEGKVVGEKYVVEVELPEGVSPPEGSEQRMFETTCTVPEGAKAGDNLKVRLPWGQVLDVTAPEGAKAGDTFGIKVPIPPGVQQQEPQIAKVPVQVPDGIKEGDPFKIKLPWGTEIEINCPPEHNAGDKFMIEVPVPPEHQQQQVVQKTVKVPEGLSAGDKFPLKTPWGAELTVTVPEGLKAGDEFNIKVPAPGPQQQRMVNVEVTIPEGSGDAEGLQKTFIAKLPWGREVTVNVPKGGKAGDKFKIEVPLPPGAPPPRRMLTQELTVPEGHDLSQPMSVTLPWGAKISVNLPEGAKEGDKFSIEVPVPPQVPQPQVFKSEITVPEGAVPGSTLNVTLPWGSVVDVKVPEGATPGNIIRLEIPVPPGAAEKVERQAAKEAQKKRRRNKKKGGKGKK